MIFDAHAQPVPASIEAVRPTGMHWLLEAGRTLLLRRPRWERVQVTPGSLLGLMLSSTLLVLLIQYFSYPTPVRFDVQAIDGGWLSTLVLLWACWFTVRRQKDAESAQAQQVRLAPLFGVVAVQGVALQWLQALAVMVTVRASVDPADRHLLLWAVWCLLHAWGFAAGLWLLGRQARSRAAWAVVISALALTPALQVWAPASDYWYSVEPEPVATAASTPEPQWVLSQEIAEAQSEAVVDTLNGLLPQRRGLVDLYAIAFAPDAQTPVFGREARMVLGVMKDRFDALGRSVLLQNQADTAGSVPWATPLNLHRAILRAAQRMDLEDDVLFIHLTSHGARDGHLAADFGPLRVEELTPQQLKAWLDEAGVRFRVISISACYSGSWVPVLKGEGTLVMTAADAEHTSYGCGRKSELTFFGRALYDEQLRHGYSFENAHAVARAVIERREKEAGKTDGYSNPQIFVGAAVRAQLAKLESRLQQQAPVTQP